MQQDDTLARPRKATPRLPGTAAAEGPVPGGSGPPWSQASATHGPVRGVAVVTSGVPNGQVLCAIILEGTAVRTKVLSPLSYERVGRTCEAD
ncbi:hypothetical protein KPB2_5564 [Klebsiella pneumoniae Kb677]|nr:hypothetical protein KPB2_5564 [Klebsiella pneumoniae Kb677]